MKYLGPSCTWNQTKFSFTSLTSFFAASSFSFSSFCSDAACSSDEDSSEGRDSINSSMSFAVREINWAKRLVWSEMKQRKESLGG